MVAMKMRIAMEMLNRVTTVTGVEAKRFVQRRSLGAITPYNEVALAKVAMQASLLAGSSTSHVDYRSDLSFDEYLQRASRGLLRDDAEKASNNTSWRFAM